MMPLKQSLSLALVIALAPLVGCGDDVTGNGTVNDTDNGVGATSVSFPESSSVTAGYKHEVAFEMAREMTTTVQDPQSGEELAANVESQSQEVRLTLAVQEVDENAVMTAIEVTVDRHHLESGHGDQTHSEPSVLQGNTYLATRSDAGSVWQIRRNGEEIAADSHDYIQLVEFLDRGQNAHAREVLSGRTLSVGDSVDFDPHVMFGHMMGEGWSAEIDAVMKGTREDHGRTAAVFEIEVRMGFEQGEQGGVQTRTTGTLAIDRETFAVTELELQGSLTFEQMAPQQHVRGEGGMTSTTQTRVVPAD